MTNEEFVEEVYHLAHKKGILSQVRTDVDILKKSNEKMSYYEIVEIVERKYNIL